MLFYHLHCHTQLRSSQTAMTLCALNKYAAFPHSLTYVFIGPLSVLVLPNQMLKVSWKPPDDAGRSLTDYIVTTTAVSDYNYSTYVKHPITSVPIRGLPQYSSGTVSVWAKNPGARSKPVVSRFRMVNIITNDNNQFTTVYYCVCSMQYPTIQLVIFYLKNEII